MPDEITLPLGQFNCPPGFHLVCALCGWRPRDDMTGPQVRVHFSIRHPNWAQQHPGLLNLTLEEGD